MGADLKVDQALFGYDSGHHLLAVSAPLSSETRHMLAVATDLSGSAPAAGFDSAFTGMPLPGTNYYALFCTWLAPEMPRPGCVWSHVLLIELADIADLDDLGSLRDSFQRPTSSHFKQYEVKLAFHVQSGASPPLPKTTATDADRLLSSLYKNPKQSVVFPAPNERSLEDLIFAVWSQQWPRLRRNFRFSTGSFADRGRTSAPFDLQVTPLANRRAWQRRGEYLLVEPSVATPTMTSADSWLEDSAGGSSQC